MQTFDLQPGEELIVGGVRVAVLEVESDVVLVRLTDGDDVYLETVRVCAEAAEAD